MRSSPWLKFASQLAFWRKTTRPPGSSKLWHLLYWSPLGIVVTSHIYEVKAISGRSMSPTLNPDWSLAKDVALFDRTAAWYEQDIDREDIVVLKSPMNVNYKLIKRVVAVEGDTVRTLPPYPVKEVVVPKGHVWVEGDDHFNSDDSNLFGPVPRALIESKLVSIIWPLDRFGPIQLPALPKDRAGPAFRRATMAFERAAAWQNRVASPPVLGPSPNDSRA